MQTRYALIFLALVPAWSQRLTGELRLLVKDSSGQALEASGLLESVSAGVRRNFRTDSQGSVAFRALPFGPYRLEVERSGFAPAHDAFEVRSETPVNRELTLSVAAIETTLTVREADTLTDPRRTSATQYLGPSQLDYRPTSMPGRSVVDQINSQPGWLLEANGVLHPRGSEYDVQYVIDGIPLYDNRSPAFAQTLGVEEFEAMSVRTAGYPAEFGRKLGGVIEVSTPHDPIPGWHGRASVQGGSFSQAGGFASIGYARGANAFAASGEGMMTDRYLDGPVEENYTNRASGGGLSLRYDRRWSAEDSTRLYFSSRHTGFQVPNENLQQDAGQRQDRTSAETLGHISHTRLFSRSIVVQVRLMARDTSAGLWSNSLSIPIRPSQSRGFREEYAGGSVAVSKGSHELKAGGEALFSSIHEDFAYHITAYRLNPGNVRIFDGDVPPDFAFSDHRQGRDQSGFVQDLWRRGPLTLSGGLRFDHYRLVADETTWSPRLGIAYAVPSAKLVLRASYDRVFQVPAIENILLASTDLSDQLGGGAFLPLRSSRGHFFEAGFTRPLLGKLRIDGTWYRRKLDNFADDSLLLNTGVSFPVAFARAEVHGYEAKIEIPAWGPFSGFVSYANMVGTGWLPVAGGLFLGDEARDLVSGQGSFPLTQDQRNTLRSRLRYQPHRRLWLMATGGYNSGLPFEIEGPVNPAFIAAQYGPRILSKVNFERGRVRPSAALGASIGLEVFKTDRARLRLQGDVMNLAGRLNLINFAGVLSGTALEPGRNFLLRLNADF